MTSRKTLTLRIDGAVLAHLGTLAKATKRSESSLAAEAVEAFLDLQERQIEGIKTAMASADHGNGVAHEEVIAWIDSWDSDEELSPPFAR